MDGLVVQGKLDEYLIRPVNPLIHLIGKNIQFGYISHISLGITVIIFVINKLGLHWGSLEWCLFVIALFGGVLIQAAISIIPSCAAFWLSKAEHLANFLRWDVREYILYPISIYPGFIRVLLTVVVPFALINYYPSFRLLGKAGLNGVLQVMPCITLMVGIVLLIISYNVWKMGLRRYNSSGT